MRRRSPTWWPGICPPCSRTFPTPCRRLPPARSDFSPFQARRAPQLPDGPTDAESGFPGFSVLTWNGLMAPTGTPKHIVDKIAAEIGRAVKDPQFVARLDQYGADPLGNTPAEFSAMLATDTALWAGTIQSLGLKF